MGCLMLFCARLVAGDGSSCFTMKQDLEKRRLDVFYDQRHIASYLYPDTLDKPVLYPLCTLDGMEVTRGYPIAPRPDERIDHPHHIGVWFNFGDVNGLDFWNNSSAIPLERKAKYGSVRHRGFKFIESNGDSVVFVITAEWVDHQGKALLLDESRYSFTKEQGALSLTHSSCLTALTDTVVLNDNKEGLFAIRVAREFEERTEAPDYFIDKDGQATNVKFSNPGKANGVYRNSEGQERGDVWGKEASWVVLSAEKEGVPISIALFDHPFNPGYPACFHARGYGLFSVNNLGKHVFDKTLDPIRMVIKKGESICFKHKLLIRSGNYFSDDELKELFRTFN